MSDFGPDDYRHLRAVLVNADEKHLRAALSNNINIIIAALSDAEVKADALREIERLRLATDEGSLRIRADRMWETARAANSRATS